MKNVKNEYLEKLSDLTAVLIEKRALKKIVLSKPDSIDELKSVITLKNISGKIVVQIETFSKDNKAYHLNIKGDFKEELYKIFLNYAQINLISVVGECQFMRSKSGKETLLGYSKLISSIDKDVAEAKVEENNKEKNYILSGKEDFLKKLGISDETGRIRDKMQSKFRQINKFIEHIDNIKDKLPKDNINI